MLLYKYLPLTWTDDLSEFDRDLFHKRCKCILNNRFWFSKPQLLNDPYDCRPFFSNIQNIEDIKRLLEDMSTEEMQILLEKYPRCRTKRDVVNLHKRILNSANTNYSTKTFAVFVLQAMARNFVNAKIANIGVLSLTSNPKSVLMWTHYANNHKGICLKVDFPESTHSLKKVQYAQKQPAVAIYEAMHEKHGRIEDLFYTKSRHWHYEDEWRMVAHEGNVSKKIPGTRIMQIFYGINISNPTKEKIGELIGSVIPTHQLRMKRNYLLV